MGMLLRRHYEKERLDLSEMTIKQLKAMAKEKGVEGYSALDKEALIEALKE
ncbi:Rho termination factor N-terminal domain-containing protein [Streptococcus suis]|nr:Rho termination factor N-terminal domain-containing protein [Streptococcus suis]